MRSHLKVGIFFFVKKPSGSDCLSGGDAKHAVFSELCGMDSLRTVIGKDLGRAATLLRGGEIVAIPTETVYGLAANALRSEERRVGEGTSRERRRGEKMRGVWGIERRGAIVERRPEV